MDPTATTSETPSARREGCARVRIYGRKGWLRVLDGYAQKYVIMDKELD